MARKVSIAEKRRLVYALIAVVSVEFVGTLGFQVIERVGWINAFYFETMLATGQGPPFTLTTDAGKIFASAMAFVSIGLVLGAVIFAFGPVMVRLWRETIGAD
jgi:hypothetical protein